jgi:hypothetical protein
MEFFGVLLNFGAKGPFVSNKSPKVGRHSHTKGPCMRW